MGLLTKKRVHWYEKNKITGETHDEDVDVWTSADAVTCDDGETIQEKIDNRYFTPNTDFTKHRTNYNNPHKVTAEQIGTYTKEEIDEFNKKLVSYSTVLSSNIDFSEVGEWGDGNPDKEDRLYYFVSVDNTDSGITMVKATSTSDIRGVTIANPAFAANASMDKFDEDHRLKYMYNYVAFAGFAIVYDYGRCTINKRCMSDDNGTAIPSSNTMGYQVIDRIDENKILILVEPNADMLYRIKNNIDYLEKLVIAGGGSGGSKIIDDEGNIYAWGKDQEGIYLECISSTSEDTVDVMLDTVDDDNASIYSVEFEDGSVSSIMNVVDDESKLDNTNYSIDLTD